MSPSPQTTHHVLGSSPSGACGGRSACEMERASVGCRRVRASGIVALDRPAAEGVPCDQRVRRAHSSISCQFDASSGPSSATLIHPDRPNPNPAGSTRGSVATTASACPKPLVGPDVRRVLGGHLDGRERRAPARVAAHNRMRRHWPGEPVRWTSMVVRSALLSSAMRGGRSRCQEIAVFTSSTTFFSTAGLQP
jgi:hypothetical protein